jgi:hypothetical protein
LAAAFAFSWLTKPFESRKTEPRDIDMCFPFSHHEQNKNTMRRISGGLFVEGLLTKSAIGFRSVRVQKGVGDVEANRRFVRVFFPKRDGRNVSE